LGRAVESFSKQMQTKTVQQVRDHSKLKGSTYLVLTCIAAHANDTGYAFPGNKLLAKASHLSERSIERQVRTLAKRGEVYMRIGRGRGNYTAYLVTCGLTKEQIKARLMEQFNLSEIRAAKAANGILKRFSAPIPKQTRSKKNPTELAIKPDTFNTENPTTVSPFIDKENPTLLAENPTELTIKPDRISIKPDTFTNPPTPPYKEVLEPLTIPEPEEHASAAPKNARRRDELFEAVAGVCLIDWTIATERQLGELRQAVGILRKQNKSPAEVVLVGEWWFAHDWRGKRGDAPRPSQIREVWAQAFAANQTQATESENERRLREINERWQREDAENRAVNHQEPPGLWLIGAG
jgi:hypothetical protein